jgi:protein-tyrosine phosphatase
MVDIHSHILPGLDDGSKSIEESVAMLELAAQAGTTDIVATPHANQKYRFQPDAITAQIAELSGLLGGKIRIHRGADFHLYFENIEEAVANPTKFTINHKCYLLVEFAEFLVGRTIDPILDRLQNAGLVPIITHPERNYVITRNIEQLRSWVSRGCLVQVTALSFLGRFGKHSKQFADELLMSGMIHFVASDAHDTRRRPPPLDEAYRYVASKAGRDRAELLFRVNPGAVLDGSGIDYEATEDVPQGRAWYQFWRS